MGRLLILGLLGCSSAESAFLEVEAGHQTAVLLVGDEVTAFGLPDAPINRSVNADQPIAATLFEAAPEALGIELGPLTVHPDGTPLPVAQGTSYRWENGEWVALEPDVSPLASIPLIAPYDPCAAATVEELDVGSFSASQPQEGPVYARTVDNRLFRIDESVTELGQTPVGFEGAIERNDGRHYALDDDAHLHLVDFETRQVIDTLLTDDSFADLIVLHVAGGEFAGGFDLFAILEDRRLIYTRIVEGAADPWLITTIEVDSGVTGWTIIVPKPQTALISTNSQRLHLATVDANAIELEELNVGEPTAIHEVQALWRAVDGSPMAVTTLGGIWVADDRWDFQPVGRTAAFEADQVVAHPGRPDTYLFGSRVAAIWEREIECVLSDILNVKQLRALPDGSIFIGGMRSFRVRW